MIRVSPSEKKYIIEGVSQNIRCDGRGRLDFRCVTVESGFLPQANGSSRVTLVNDSTDVIAAVKAELGPIDPSCQLLNEGRLVVSVECCPSVSPKLDGRMGADISAELTTMLDRMLVSSRSIDTAGLCVVEGKFAWTVYVDVMVLDSGGNIFDLVSLAAFSALNNARLPKLRVVDGVGGSGMEGESEVELTDDPEDTVALVCANIPITVTLSQIGNKFVVDTTAEEEACVDCCLQVAVDSSGRICGIHKKFEGGFQPAEIRALLQAARHTSALLFGAVNAALKEEETADAATELSVQSIKLGFMA